MISLVFCAEVSFSYSRLENLDLIPRKAFKTFSENFCFKSFIRLLFYYSFIIFKFVNVCMVRASNKVKLTKLFFWVSRWLTFSWWEYIYMKDIIKGYFINFILDVFTYWQSLHSMAFSLINFWLRSLIWED